MSSWIPISAIVAIVIFIIREWREYSKKTQEKKRKILALKLILARECEQNYYALQSFGQIFHQIRCAHYDRIVNQVEGAFCSVTIVRATGEESALVPLVRRERAERVMLDVAVADESLYSKFEDYFSAIEILEHFADSLRNPNRGVSLIGMRNYYDGLSGYGVEEAAKVKIAIADLYKECTGKNAIVARIR